MAAEAPEVVGRLTGDFHRAARAVRQIIALKARLAHDAQRQNRDERALARDEARETGRRPHWEPWLWATNL